MVLISVNHNDLLNPKRLRVKSELADFCSRRISEAKNFLATCAILPRNFAAPYLSHLARIKTTAPSGAAAGEVEIVRSELISTGAKYKFLVSSPLARGSTRTCSKVNSA
jgi:hypothetical protein